MIAAGFGCRKGCSGHDLLLALRGALAAAQRDIADVRALYAPEFKGEEPALQRLAQELDKPLQFLREDQLQLQAAHAQTRSEQVENRFNLPSIAETAALAGACLLANSSANRPTLLGPRFIAGSATCALATLDIQGAS